MWTQRWYNAFFPPSFGQSLAYLLLGFVADYCLLMVEDFTHTHTES